MIWDVSLLPVLFWLKIGHSKTRNVLLAGQQQKYDATQHLQTKALDVRPLDVLRDFFIQISMILEVWWPEVII